MSRMRIVIMGAGGLGGYFGARLAAAGNDVAFIARGKHLEAIRQNGLQISSALGDLHLRDVVATDQPSALSPADVIMVAVKLWDTEAAAEAIKPLVRPGIAVVSFQNGVGKDEVLTRILGGEAVIGGVGQIGVVIADPGVIAHTGTMAKLIFGEFDNRRSKRVEALLDACLSAGIDAEIPPDINLAIWEKFAFLVPMAACTASMRSSIGPIRGNPQARGFLLDVMREVVSVGRAGLSHNWDKKSACRHRSIARSPTFWHFTWMAHPPRAHDRIRPRIDVQSTLEGVGARLLQTCAIRRCPNFIQHLFNGEFTPIIYRISKKNSL
jgi:2-dehydropantoate 2-reductase